MRKFLIKILLLINIPFFVFAMDELTLVSKDGVQKKISERAAKFSNVIKNLLDDDGFNRNDLITLSTINGDTLEITIKTLEAINNLHINTSNLNLINGPIFTEEFINRDIERKILKLIYSYNINDIVTIINGANYLEIPLIFKPAGIGLIRWLFNQQWDLNLELATNFSSIPKKVKMYAIDKYLENCYLYNRQQLQRCKRFLNATVAAKQNNIDLSFNHILAIIHYIKTNNLPQNIEFKIPVEIERALNDYTFNLLHILKFANASGLKFYLNEEVKFKKIAVKYKPKNAFEDMVQEIIADYYGDSKLALFILKSINDFSTQGTFLAPLMPYLNDDILEKIIDKLRSLPELQKTVIDNQEYSPLFYALQYTNPFMVNLFITELESLNVLQQHVVLKYGHETVLMMAVKYGTMDVLKTVVQKLEEFGLLEEALKEKDDMDLTVLMRTSKLNNLEKFVYIKEQVEKFGLLDEQLNLLDKNNNSLLIWAKKELENPASRYEDLVNYILSLGK